MVLRGVAGVNTGTITLKVATGNTTPEQAIAGMIVATETAMSKFQEDLKGFRK